MSGPCAFCESLGARTCSDMLDDTCAPALCDCDNWPNTVFQLRCREATFPAHGGPISIKCAFGGVETYDLENRSVAVGERHYLLMNAGEQYRSRIQAPAPVESFCVFFRSGFVEEVLRSLENPSETLLDRPDESAGSPPLFVNQLRPHDDVVSPVLRDLRRALSGKGVDPNWLEQRFHDLAEALVRLHRGDLAESGRVPALRPSTRTEVYRRLALAREFIEGHLAARAPLREIARAAAMSPHHLLRTFQQTFGETPRQYQRRRRLEHASHLLRTTDRRVTDICLAVGFDSLGSFSSLFRRSMGMSPRRFRAATAGIARTRHGADTSPSS